jgi:hypothetical protein
MKEFCSLLTREVGLEGLEGFAFVFIATLRIATPQLGGYDF